MIKPAEFRERIIKLQQLIKNEDIKALLVSAEESIYYLTGVSYVPLERPFFIIVRPSGECELLVPTMEDEHMRAAPNISRVTSYWEYPSPEGLGWPEKLNAALSGIDKLGVEPSLPREISDQLGGFSLQTLPLIEELRLVKSAAEVEMVKAAARYSQLAVEKILDTAYYGVSEIELFGQGRNVQLKIIQETDCDLKATDVLAGSWVAPMSAQPHSIPAVDDILKEGPHIAIGFIRANGYAAECERTYFLSPPTKEEQAHFAAMLEASRIALEMVRPGIECGEIDKAANDFLKAEGYDGYRLHRTGHGFGIGSHEGPWVAEGSQHVLQENMLISIEPGIYIPGLGGFRHSDTVLVTRDGYELLTNYPRDIQSLTITSSKPLKRFKGRIIRKVAGI